MSMLAGIPFVLVNEEPTPFMVKPRVPLPKEYLKEQLLAFQAERGLKDDEYAELIGIAPRTLSRIRKGEDGNWTRPVRESIQAFVEKHPIGAGEEPATYIAGDLTIDFLCERLIEAIDLRHPELSRSEFEQVVFLKNHLARAIDSWMSQQH